MLHSRDTYMHAVGDVFEGCEWAHARTHALITTNTTTITWAITLEHTHTESQMLPLHGDWCMGRIKSEKFLSDIVLNEFCFVFLIFERITKRKRKFSWHNWHVFGDVESFGKIYIKNSCSDRRVCEWTVEFHAAVNVCTCHRLVVLCKIVNSKSISEFGDVFQPLLNSTQNTHRRQKYRYNQKC